MSKEEEGKDGFFRCNPDGFTAGKGFTMTFRNGNTVSVQWHDGSYSDGKNTAEVAAWDDDGRWHYFEQDEQEVKGWLSPDGVAKFIYFVQSNELNHKEKKE